MGGSKKPKAKTKVVQEKMIPSKEEEVTKLTEDPFSTKGDEYIKKLRMSQRMSDVEKELRELKKELEKARNSLTKKDRELEAMRAKMSKSPKPYPVFVRDDEATTAHGNVAPYQRRKKREFNELSISEDEEIAELEITRTEPELAYSLTRSDASTLEKECERLSKKVQEMERFLADYGLIWVGEPEGGEELGITGVAYSPNMERILLIIDEMNYTNQGPQIASTSHGATFKRPEAIRLTLYKNGMKLGDNPFREYSTPSVMQFFRDLEDGYYPTELKGHFPEGVTFNVIDKRDVDWEPVSEPKIFCGKGYTLRDSVKEGETLPEQPTAPEQRKNLTPPPEDAKGSEKKDKKSEKKKKEKLAKSNEPSKNTIKEPLAGSIKTDKTPPIEEIKPSETTVKKQEINKSTDILKKNDGGDSYSPDKSFWVNKKPEITSQPNVDIVKKQMETQTDDALTKYPSYSRPTVETSSVAVQTTISEVGKVKMMQRVSGSNDKRVSQEIPSKQPLTRQSALSGRQPSPPRLSQKHLTFSDITQKPAAPLDPPQKLPPPLDIPRFPSSNLTVKLSPTISAQKKPNSEVPQRLSPTRDVPRQQSPFTARTSGQSSQPPPQQVAPFPAKQEPMITKISYHEAPITLIRMPVNTSDSYEETKVEDLTYAVGKGGSEILKNYEQKRKIRFAERKEKYHRDRSDTVEVAYADARRPKYHEGKKRRSSQLEEECVEWTKPIKSPHTVGVKEHATVADILRAGKRLSYLTEYGAKYNAGAPKIKEAMEKRNEPATVSGNGGADATEYEHMVMIKPGLNKVPSEIEPSVSTVSRLKEKKGLVKEINPKTSENQITIKVRDGDDQLVLNVYPDEPISRVYSLVDADPETYRLTYQGGSKGTLEISRQDAMLKEYNIDKNTLLTLSKIPSETVSVFQVTRNENKPLKPHPTIWQVSQSVLRGEKKLNKAKEKEKSPVAPSDAPLDAPSDAPSVSVEQKSGSPVGTSVLNDFSEGREASPSTLTPEAP